MDKIDTIALAGLGAVGSAYLARISENVPMDRIRVVSSGERAERYRKNGVSVNGRRYFFPVTEPENGSPADLVIYAVKQHHLPQAISDSRRFVGPDTVILPLLNGIRSEADLGAAFGAKKVLYALVMGLDAVREGDNTSSACLGTIQFGEAVSEEGRWSRKVRLVKEFLDSAGVPCEVMPDMKRALWKKFMINVGVNQVTAVLRSAYGAIQRPGEARALVRSAMEEAAAAAAREGISLSAHDVGDGLSLIDRLPPGGMTSMAQDVEARRKTEVEIFGETVVELGEKHGIPVPVNAMLSRVIRAMEESYTTAR
ncbi:MAG: 2-dehydropantoate 2-reductase [Synergistaceae bacterium]|jgi:2-dehydropantoate 2-reductase|nr:2-dehydropantoate 2-reductase [Synergistaceae bacterium]